MAMSTKKKVNRYFNGAEVMRLIVTVEVPLVEAVDDLISVGRWKTPIHACHRNRAEFVRQAISEKLERDLARTTQLSGGLQ